MTDLSSLIAKLEQAESGSRELDEEIAVAAGYVPYVLAKLGTKWVLDNKELWRLPPFSESLDAALTLIPEAWSYSLIQSGARYGVHLSHETLPNQSASGKTPALAIVIAALKARSRAEGK